MIYNFTFTQEELFAKICSLSYMGDLRMLFAEDRNKVKLLTNSGINFASNFSRAVNFNASFIC